MDDERRSYDMPIQPVAGYQPPPPPPPVPRGTVTLRRWMFVGLLALVGSLSWLIGVAMGLATPDDEEGGDTETAAAQQSGEEAQSTEPTTTEAPTTTAPPTTPAPTQPPGPDTSFGDGTYVVNEDIAPGQYRSGGSDDEFGCYWERLSGFNGSFEEIIANGNEDGPAVIAIEPTDVGFSSSGCGTWELAG